MQVIYARAADVADRYDAVVGVIRQAAVNADKVFVDSAAETGGLRHVRWVTDASCGLAVDRVQLSASGDDSLTATQTELSALGYNRSDRKYLIMVDAMVYCGISGIRSDDRPTADNTNETAASYSRVDSNCWSKSTSVEAHELMHGLGGVQLSAPHSSGAFHCTEEYERMCYADSADDVMTYPCASTHETLFDCNHDDYFHTSPPAGSYLATHWNSAMSSFLESTEPGTAPPSSATTTTVASTTTTTTVAPPTSTSTSWSGSLSRKISSRTYNVSAGAGTITATATFSKAPSLTLTFLRADGSEIGRQTGASPVSGSVVVPAGTYAVRVTAAGNATYQLTVTYSAP